MEDGGGPGSLSQLRIIGEYMSRLAFEKRVDVDSLFPAELFDVIGGVGFGAYVVIFDSIYHFLTDSKVCSTTSWSSAYASLAGHRRTRHSRHHALPARPKGNTFGGRKLKETEGGDRGDGEASAASCRH